MSNISYGTLSHCSGLFFYFITRNTYRYFSRSVLLLLPPLIHFNSNASVQRRNSPVGATLRAVEDACPYNIYINLNYNRVPPFLFTFHYSLFT